MKKTLPLMTYKEYQHNVFTKYKQPALYSEWFLYPDTDPECRVLSEKLNALFRTGKAGIGSSSSIIEDFGLTNQQSRGIACMVGLGIADALGASTEFIPFQKDRQIPLIEKGFAEISEKVKYEMLNERGEVGVWTDDCSMALCLADSLLSTKLVFDPLDLRLRFMLWIDYGLNNGGRPYSIGLGGNIAQSMYNFLKVQAPYTEELDKFNNGNGSLMRLGPVPIAYHRDIERAMEVALQQSKTTHNGDEAGECCRLLASIISNLINRDSIRSPKDVILSTCDDFQTKDKSVHSLARGQQDPDSHFLLLSQNHKFGKFNQSPELDRNWNWRSESFTYSTTRTKQQPMYVGSYCMDALAMALHISLFKEDFNSSILYAANMGGDSDTVGAIVGQITGAMYGLDHGLMYLYSQMPDVKRRRYQLFKTGYKLVMTEG